MKIDKTTDLKIIFVPEYFYCKDKPFHPDFPEMIYRNYLPINLTFTVSASPYIQEGYYLTDRIRTVGTDDYLKYKEYFDEI
jgi:hypothetical protein